MQLIAHKRSNLQVNPVLAQMPDPYPRNHPQQQVTRSPLALQFRHAESRDVAMDLSRDSMSLGLEGGGAPRMDLETVLSHGLLGGTVESPRLPAGE